MPKDSGPCAGSAAAPCAEDSLPALELTDALQHFAREAVHGVCDTGRYRCSYFLWGEGPPLLFLHGMGDEAQAYVPLISLLAKDFRCIAYELPTGRGDGARLDRYRHTDLVEDLFALLDHLDVHQSYLFASSFGSVIALAALARQPSRLPRAVLSGGFAQRQLAPAERLLARVAAHLPGSVGWLPLRRLIGQQAFGPRASKRPEYFAFFLTNTARPPLTALAGRAALLQELDLRPLLAEIPQPVLLICGDADPVVRPECAEVLLQGLRHGARVELPGCGHLPHYSHPEATAALVRDFLTPRSAGRP